MHVSPRSYLTAGIAALSVGALALAPVQPIPNQITAAPKAVVSDMAVSLAAAVDPIAAWVNVFQTSAANIEILGKFNEQNPFPLLKTIGANIATYIEEISNGQIDLVFEQIWNNIQTFFTAPWDPGSTITLPNTAFPPPNNEAVVPLPPPLGEVTYLSNTQPGIPAGNTRPGASPQSPAEAQIFALQLIAGISQTATPDDDTGPLWELIVSPIAPLLVFLNTPYSGQLLSWIGPLLAPVVALTKSFTAVGEYFQEGKVLDAVYELINIPANMTNAFLNGAGFLNLTPVLGQFFDLPEAFKDILIGFNVGGLLNAMPQDGSLVVNPEDPQPARPTVWAGGTAFDSLAIPGCGPGGGGGGGGGDIDPCDFIDGQPITGLTNGLFGAGIGLGQFLAEKLLVTPPQEAPAAVAAPQDVQAPALAEVPAEETVSAVVDDPAPVEAPAAVVDEVAAETATTIVDEVADVEVTDEADVAVISEDLEVDAPAEIAAVTEDSVAEEAPADAGSDDSGDSGSRASDSRRGSSSDD